MEIKVDMCQQGIKWTNQRIQIYREDNNRKKTTRAFFLALYSCSIQVSLIHMNYSNSKDMFLVRSDSVYKLKWLKACLGREVTTHGTSRGGPRKFSDRGHMKWLGALLLWNSTIWIFFNQNMHKYKGNSNFWVGTTAPTGLYLGPPLGTSANETNEQNNI